MFLLFYDLHCNYICGETHRKEEILFSHHVFKVFLALLSSITMLSNQSNLNKLETCLTSQLTSKIQVISSKPRIERCSGQCDDECKNPKRI